MRSGNVGAYRAAGCVCALLSYDSRSMNVYNIIRPILVRRCRGSLLTPAGISLIGCYALLCCNTCMRSGNIGAYRAAGCVCALLSYDSRSINVYNIIRPILVRRCRGSLLTPAGI